MKHLINRIILFLLCMACVSAFADTSFFTLTDGKESAGSEKPVDYAVDLHSGTLSEGDIISLTQTRLDNGCVRYTLVHRVPAGYQMHVFGAGNSPKLKAQNSNGVTSGNQETVAFDIPYQETIAVQAVVLNIYRSDNDRMFISFKADTQEDTGKSVSFVLSAGEPADGSAVPLQYSTEVISEAFDESSIIGLTRTPLDNGYSRYTLEHQMPAGYGMSFFGSGNKVRLKKQIGNGETAGGPDSVVFDLPDSETAGLDSVIISIFKSDDDRVFLTFQPFFQASEESDYFPLTDGRPVDGKEEDLAFQVNVGDTISGPNENIINLRKTKLDNGYSRYKLDFDLPAGLGLNLFAYGTSPNFRKQQATATTKGGRDTATFDVSDSEAMDVGTIVINFYSTVSDDRILVPFSPYEGICFNLTDGTPADGTETEITIFYIESVPSAIKKALISLKKVTLDNGYSRYTLEHSLPKGYRLYLFGGGPNPRLTPTYRDEPTSGKQETITFDILDSDAAADNTIVLNLTKGNSAAQSVYFNPFDENMNAVQDENPSVPLQIADGNPVDGSVFPLSITTADLPKQVKESDLIGLTRMQLDNGYSRYTLEYRLPEGYHMRVFGAGDSPDLTPITLNETTGGQQETVVFDLSDSEVQKVGMVVISFYKENSNNSFFAFFSPFE